MDIPTELSHQYDYMKKQIIALGGGGFWMEPDNTLLDEYIIRACSKENPVISFLPTASGDSDWYTMKFYTAFNRYRCTPRHISLFRQSPDLQGQLFESDAIYVGGGNTRNMLAIWRVAGVVEMLREAWENGTVLCGLSAGAICWFEEGHTDSTGELGRLDCLGFLKGSCSPHYDGEAERRPSYHKHIRDGLLSPGLALDDGVAARFEGTKLVEYVSSRVSARAYQVSLKNKQIIEKRLKVRYLG